MDPIRPLGPRDPGVHPVDPVPRVRLLTPAEREQARRDRERKRREREAAQDPRTGADYRA